MDERERQFYDNVVHSLRSQGWSRIEAEGEAMDKVERLRQRQAASERTR